MNSNESQCGICISADEWLIMRRIDGILEVAIIFREENGYGILQKTTAGRGG